MIGKSTSQQQNALFVPRATNKIYGADEVHSAITNGKLLNYYQPKVDTVTRKVVGVEALVRWFHPQDGMVYPNQFISVAEAHGLIDDLTQVVLSHALAQTRAWQDAGILLHVSVNLSVNSLGSPDFADSIVESSAKAGVPPQLVELEVAKSCLEKKSGTPMDVLGRLRQKEFRVSINDFDIENSSLEMLSDLPFDGIKLEPSTVLGARNNEILRNKIESTIGLAKQLGMSVGAVGVEDAADWNFLKRTGCNTSQGGLIAHPMPGPNFPGWIRSWNSVE
jgi:EAL domain-containing protein (putative c-di-GMP-specific phosphodiesterase class I)